MTMGNKLKRSLLEKSKEVIPPTDLKQKIMNKIVHNAGRGKMKKRIAAGIIAASILIPTSAIAVEGYLADSLYGSFQNLKKHIATASMEGYMRLNAKLSQAKGELSFEEYETFTKYLKVLSAARLEYGDQDGYINYDAISDAETKEIKLALMEIQPYFDRLNDLKSSKDVLSPQEYEEYIDALMTNETILVKSGLKPEANINLEKIKPELLDEFNEAEAIIKEVDQRMINNASPGSVPMPEFTTGSQACSN